MTKYSDVFEIVLSLMESYKINIIFDTNDESGINTFFLPYIKFASGELENNNATFNISDRNDTIFEFNEDLSDGKQLIIAKLIITGYLSKETHDILQMKLHLQDGDFKTYAEKNNLEGKLTALYMLKEEINYDLKKTGYNSFLW
jgi:hypothetical protein